MNAFFYERIIAYDKPKDAERLYTIKELKALKPGDKVILNTTDVEDPFATYVGTVVKAYEHHIVLNILITEESVEHCKLGEPKPYNFSVRYLDNGRTSYVWKIREELL